MTVPKVSIVEAHPFTLTSAPGDDFYEVSIRNLGDYTAKLRQVVATAALPSSAEPVHVWAAMEGPYGSLDIAYGSYDVLCLVAGGVGITPVMAILKDIFRSGNASASQSHLLREVVVIWTVQQFTQFGWFHDEVKSCLFGVSPVVTEGPSLHIRVHASRQVGPNAFERAAMSTTRASLTFTASRPVLREQLHAVARSATRDRRIFVLGCGPTMLVRDLWDTVTEMQWSGFKIDWHREVFEL